ncbi:hypothetical protein PTKU15_10100 [Paraburkholderia terrae]|nr:hypothetical protein PTKU15_10100 [Paraburkholderia terrae]
MLAIFDRLMKVIPICPLKFALMSFVAGLLFDGMAVGCSYWTQYTLFNEGFERMRKGRHIAFLVFATVLCIFSLLAFCIGAAVGALSAHAIT